MTPAGVTCLPRRPVAGLGPVFIQLCTYHGGGPPYCISRPTHREAALVALIALIALVALFAPLRGFTAYSIPPPYIQAGVAPSPVVQVPDSPSLCNCPWKTPPVVAFHNQRHDDPKVSKSA